MKYIFRIAVQNESYFSNYSFTTHDDNSTWIFFRFFDKKDININPQRTEFILVHRDENQNPMSCYENNKLSGHAWQEWRSIHNDNS